MKKIIVAAVILMVSVAACNNEKKIGALEKRYAISGGEPASKPPLKKNSFTDKRVAKGSGARLSKSRPNVVIVLLDTLRPDYLGFQGFEEETAPFLAKLAQESTVFKNALSTSSWTTPSVSSLFTSLYPPQHGVVQGFRLHRENMSKLKTQGKATIQLNSLPEDRSTLSERFRKLGYRTYGLAANINIGKEVGFDRGFDRFEKRVKAPAEFFYKKVIEWKDDILGTEPFFLYLHFNDPHAPYLRRKPYYKAATNKKDDVTARYRSEIGYVDNYIRKIWSIPGIADDTLLVFVSDHGEEFWDHGGTGHGPTLYWELNHILFMIHGPELGITAQRIEENVSLLDVLPTLMDLIAGQRVEDAEGISLKAILTGDAEADALKKRLQERCLFAYRMYSSRRKLALWSVTCGNWKLIDWFGDRRKLFDHKTDPGEYYNLSSERLKMTEQLTERIQTFKNRMEIGEKVSEQTEITMDEGLVQKLRSLGYVD